MDKRLQAGLYRSFLHPLLAIGVPFLFLSACLRVMVGNAASAAGIRVFPPFFGWILLAAGLSEAVTGNLLAAERAISFAARLREIVFVLLASALLLLVATGQLLSGSLRPGAADFWVPLLTIGLQWTATLYIHSRLRAREALYALFRGTDPAKAKETYHDAGSEANEAVAAVLAVRTFCALMGAFGFALVAAMAWGFRVPFNLADAALILGFFGSCFAAVAVFNSFLRAQTALMDGLVPPRSRKRARAVLAAALMAAACLIAVPLTGRKAPLPESYLFDAYEWARSIGRDRGIPRKEAKMPELQSTATNDFIPDYMGQAKRTSGERRDYGNIAGAVGWALLAVFVAAVAAFLFLPLLRRGREGFHPLARLAALWAAARDALRRGRDSWRAWAAGRRARRDAKAWDRTKPKPVKAETAGKRSVLSAIFGRREQGTRAPTGRHQRAFQRFVHWGERKGARFTTSLGAVEYARLVAEKAPEAREGCAAVGALFERIVFSGRDVGEEVAAEYHQAVDRTMRQ